MTLSLFTLVTLFLFDIIYLTPGLGPFFYPLFFFGSGVGLLSCWVGRGIGWEEMYIYLAEVSSFETSLFLFFLHEKLVIVLGGR